MSARHPQRARWPLAGPWRIKDERSGTGRPRPYVGPDLEAEEGAGEPRPYTDWGAGEREGAPRPYEPAHPYVAPDYADGAWLEVPPATHVQPWLYPDNPYWGSEVRQVNQSAWWYRTRFVTPKDAAGQRLRLCFEGVDYYCEVWLNGHYLGRHEGAFAAFSFDVTSVLAAQGAENTLAVRVTSPWDPPRKRGLTYVDEVARGMVKGLYAHADGLIPPDVNPLGIWRPVWLEMHPDVTLDNVRYRVVEDEHDRSARLTLHLDVHNRSSATLNGVLHLFMAGETFEAIRADEHLPVELPPGKHVLTQELRVPDPQWWWPWDLCAAGPTQPSLADRALRPRRWYAHTVSPPNARGTPDLYRLRCTLWGREDQAPDVHEQVLGLRRVKLLRTRETTRFQINKQTFFVRGTTYLGDVYLSRLTPERIEADLKRVVECGFNLIRLHVHVAPREVYEVCDRLGLLIWQDFELNWFHDPSPEFEERAVAVQRAMVEQLGGHPSILAWCCHNEPTALPFLDRNLSEHPTRRLYRELTALDRSRPAFLCSGKQTEDWLNSGDSHAYVGGAHGGHYLDVYGARVRLVSEFGCEAPLNVETLDEVPLPEKGPRLAERLAHIRDQIPDLQVYQAALLKYQIEWYRITRLEPCGGYIQFMFCDAYPQVGCGVLDAARRPKAAYEAVRAASQPVHVLLERDANGPVALWAVNDQRRPLVECLVEWEFVRDGGGVVSRGSAQVDLPAMRVIRVALLHWQPDTASDRRYHLVLRLRHRGAVVDENHYADPFHALPRPAYYPWHFDRRLGMRCYGGPHAQSSLKVLNTWYGRLARWVLPIYEWVEGMLGGKQNPALNAWLKRFFG